MNDQQRAAMQMALEALETLNAGDSYKTHNAATALREALAQPQGEPVAWIHRYKTGAEQINNAPPETYVGWTHIPLYTAPPSVEAAIEATKEKAAKVCEERSAMYNRASGEAWEAEQCAAAIRSMK